MSSIKKFVGLLGLSALLTVMLALPAQARQPGLVQVAGTVGLYWVDGFSIKHYVPDAQLALHFFGNDLITEISANEMLSLPKGQALSFATPPWVFDRERDPQAVAEHIPVVNVRYEQVSMRDGIRSSTSQQTSVSAQPALAPVAEERRHVLVRGDNSRELYFVDRFGIRHPVRGGDRQTFFSGVRIEKLSSDEVDRMPLGHSINERTPPHFYDSVQRNTLAVNVR
jgi:hypothetical protein